MERQEILNKFIQILKDDICITIDNNSILEDKKISDLQLDELDCVEIEIELENQLNLPQESCDSFVSNSETIKDVIDKLSKIIK